MHPKHEVRNLWKDKSWGEGVYKNNNGSVDLIQPTLKIQDVTSNQGDLMMQWITMQWYTTTAKGIKHLVILKESEIWEMPTSPKRENHLHSRRRGYE